MIRTAVRPCPVCLHSSVIGLHFQRFLLSPNHPLASGYQVVSCERCGFVYADSAVTQEDYDRFYAELSKYEDSKTSTGAGESSSDAQRLAETAECIAAVLRDKAARILDVGCANGGLLRRLQQMGFANVCGFDLPARCVENTRALGIEAHHGSVTQHPPGAGQFDLIILSHVMEHLRELHQSVWSLESLLRKGGAIYIEVPDASEYVSHLAAPFQDFNTEHINHFSARCMENLMGQLGFSGSGLGQKVFDSSPGMTYPALFGFWRKTETFAFRVQRDETLVEKIRDYIARSRAMMEAMDARLKTALAKSPEVIVWGTGQLAMKLMIDTCLAQAAIVAFIDGNPVNVGKKLNGIEIQSPSQLAGRPQPIIITTTLHQQAIADRIRHELKLPNEIIFLSESKSAAS